jgi:2-desacetyl-2-hydroxyethyl bacteriochlorophyllide A dehydrogenase
MIHELLQSRRLQATLFTGYVMATRLLFTSKQEVAFESYPTPIPTATHVLIRTRYTLMSTGTENIVFNRMFEPDTGWDAWVKYPFYPGYLNVGRVEAVGAEVKDWQVGQGVFSRCGHGSHHIFDTTTDTSKWIVKLDGSIPEREATWLGLAKIAAMGARVADIRLGQSVAVVGAGPIGQMALRWSAAAGAYPLVAIDPVAQRLELAKRGGATHVIAKKINEVRDDLRSACGGTLPQVVIDSTGHAAVFAAILPLVAKFGRLVLLGDTGTPSQQHLTQDFLYNGLTIVGAHDSHDDDKWNLQTITPLVENMVRQNRFSLDGLISHTFNAVDCRKAYELANTRRGDTMGIQFDWTTSE